MENISKRDSFTVYHYDSVDEFVERAAGSFNCAANREHIDTINSSGRSWLGGVSSFDEAARIARGGWMEGLRRIDDALGQLDVTMASPVSQRRRKQRGPEGSELDIHRVLAGDFDHAWHRTTRQARIGPRHFTIVANSSDSSATSTDEMFWRGAAIARLTDIMTDAGYTVRVCYAVSGRGMCSPTETIASMVTIKDFSAPLDRLSLVSAVAHPSFYRMIGLTWESKTFKQKCGYGLAMSARVPAVADEIVLTSGVFDAASAKRWIEEQVAKLDAAHNEQEAA